jgi:hypothetical protein
MNQSGLIATGVVAGVAVGAVIAVVANNALQAQTSYPTFRPGIKSAMDEELGRCTPFPFTNNHHPTKMFQIMLPGLPFDIRNMRPVITEMDVTTSPWTEGDPTTSKPYAGHTTWSPNTPLDLDLNLSSTAGPGKHDKALIKIVVEDQNVKMIADPFTVVSGDANKQMFCRFSGGFTEHSATFMTSYYYKPNSNGKTMGSYNLGVNIPAADNSYVLPIYIDPAVENNG